MKTLHTLIATALLFTTPAFAGQRIDDVAKSAINAYLLFQELPGAFPGGQKPSPAAVCALAGAAETAFLLLSDRTDKEISQLVELVREEEMPALRERVLNDLKGCLSANSVAK